MIELWSPMRCSMREENLPAVGKTVNPNRPPGWDTAGTQGAFTTNSGQFLWRKTGHLITY
jgi:hypothetical protein